MNKLIAVLIIAGTLSLLGCSVKRDTYKLTVKVQGEGIVEPSSATSYTEETIVPLQAVPADGWVFYRWQGDVAEPYSPKTATYVDKAKAIKAIFLKTLEPTVLEAPGGLITWRSDGSKVSPRPQGVKDIEYLMIHAISDAAANPTRAFQLDRIRTIFASYNVEAHYVIDRTGTIYRFVEDDLIARHAGVGSWANDPKLTNAMNRYAIGIELMGIGSSAEMEGIIGPTANRKIKSKDRGYTDQQYQALDTLVYDLSQRYGIPEENIISHSSYDPGRKWDPGVLFDWSKIQL